MKQIEKTVFISYRRTNIFTARAVYDNLTRHGYDVFFDYENIDSGDFSQIILRSIESRAHFLLILTPSALERCQNPGDWLRREIEHALEHKRNIIPLTFEGFEFRQMQEQLPPNLAEPLGKYNGIRVPADFFDEAMTRLRDRFLNVPLDTVLHPASAQTRQYENTQQQKAQAQPAVTEADLTAEEYFERGLARNAQDYDAKIADYSEAIRLKPDYADAYYNRGLAYYHKGQYDRAIADYDEAIRLKPDYADAYNNRGNAYNNKGQTDRAIADYVEAIRLKPDYADAYNNRGVAYNNKGQYDRAIADYDEAIRLKPDYANAYKNRGLAYYEKGDARATIRDWERALELNPNISQADTMRDNIRNLKAKL